MKELIISVFIVICCLSAGIARADEPAQCQARLFHIGKSTNGNVVMYELNQDQNGGISSKEPVGMYWIYSDQKIENLTWLEKKLAYGIKYLGKNKGEFYVTSVPEKIVELDERNGCIRAYTVIAGELAELEEVFVNATGSGITTNVISINLKGKTISGEPVTETLRKGS